MKRYTHSTPNARFILPTGRDLTFANGIYETDKEDEISELDKVANKPGSFIYTDTPVIVESDTAPLAEITNSVVSSTDDSAHSVSRITGRGR